MEHHHVHHQVHPLSCSCHDNGSLLESRSYFNIASAPPTPVLSRTCTSELAYHPRARPTHPTVARTRRSEDQDIVQTSSDQRTCSSVAILPNHSPRSILEANRTFGARRIFKSFSIGTDPTQLVTGIPNTIGLTHDRTSLRPTPIGTRHGKE